MKNWQIFAVLSLMCVVSGIFGGATVAVTIYLLFPRPAMESRVADPVSPSTKPIVSEKEELPDHWNAVTVEFQEPVVLKEVWGRHNNFAGLLMTLFSTDAFGKPKLAISSPVRADEEGKFRLKVFPGDLKREVNNVLVCYESRASVEAGLKEQEIVLTYEDARGVNNIVNSRSSDIRMIVTDTKLIVKKAKKEVTSSKETVTWQALQLIGKSVKNTPFSISGQSKQEDKRADNKPILAGRTIKWMVDLDGDQNAETELGSAVADGNGVFLIHSKKNLEIPAIAVMQVLYEGPASEEFHAADFLNFHGFATPIDYDAKFGSGAHLHPDNKNIIVIE